MTRRALPGPVEILGSGLRVPGQHVLRLEERRAAERVIDALPQKVGKVDDLIVGQRRCRPAALHLVSALQKGPELVAISIAQDDERARQVRSIVGAARLGAVTIDALGRPHGASPVRQRGFDKRRIRRPRAHDAAAGTSASRRGRRLLAAASSGRRLRRLSADDGHRCRQAEHGHSNPDSRSTGAAHGYRLRSRHHTFNKGSTGFCRVLPGSAGFVQGSAGLVQGSTKFLREPAG